MNCTPPAWNPHRAESDSHFPSNSQDRDGFHVVGVGIDTLRLGWSGIDFSNLTSIFRYGTIDQVTGEMVHPRKGVIKHARRGVCFGLSAAANSPRQLWAEGRLSAAIPSGCSPLDLAVPEFLLCSEISYRAFASQLGIDIPTGCVATVRRLDPAVDVAFERPCDGLAYIEALSSLDLPRLKRNTWHAKGSSVVETVSWSLESGTQVRIYDKFTEVRKATKRLDAGAAGGRLRLERQWRIPPARRSTPFMLLGDPARGAEFARVLAIEFARYFEPWALERLVVSRPLAAYHHLKARIGHAVVGRNRDGSPRLLSERVAERIMGSLIALYHEGDEAFANRRTARDRRAELRRFGIVLSDTIERVIELGYLIETALAAWRQVARDRDHQAGLRAA